MDVVKASKLSHVQRRDNDLERLASFPLEPQVHKPHNQQSSGNPLILMPWKLELPKLTTVSDSDPMGKEAVHLTLDRLRCPFRRLMHRYRGYMTWT